MCFNINSEKRVAKRDITAYKVISTSVNPCIVYSRYQGFKYTLGKLYKTQFIYSDGKRKPLKDFDSVFNGFHSYTSKKAAHDLDFIRCYVKVIKCIIPTGAEYYKNTEDQEYVSTQIILVKIYG